MSGARVRAIVLAAQRPGTADPLAQRFALTHKALIPLSGRPLVAHVVRTLLDHERIADVVISVEREAFGAIRMALESAAIDPSALRFVPSASNLADSVIGAAKGHDGPILVTTADNALLRAASIDAMSDALGGADVAIAMARKESVRAAHPEGQRRFYRFRDAEYSNCNLYAMAGPKALSAAELFRGGGQFAKKVGRIVGAFGLVNLVLMRLAVFDLHSAMGRVSRRIGMSIAPVILDDGSQAIDVDNDRTLRCVEEILSARASKEPLPRTRQLVLSEGSQTLQPVGSA